LAEALASGKVAALRFDCTGVVVATVSFSPDESVTDSLNPAKARRTPIEQRTKPIKTRGLKKADREADFVFIEAFLFVFVLPLMA